MVIILSFTGVYKPRVRCYDVSQLSMKFERCMDSEVVKFCVLSDDYSKVSCCEDLVHILHKLNAVDLVDGCFNS